MIERIRAPRGGGRAPGRRWEGAGRVSGRWRPLWLGAALGLGLLAACQHGDGDAVASPSPQARYLGLLPCADCAGERWDLQLFASTGTVLTPGRYALQRTRLRADGAGVTEILRGRWTQMARPALGRSWDTYRLAPNDGTPVLTLQRVADGQLRLTGSGRADAPAWTLSRVEVPRQPGVIDVVARDAAVPLHLQPGQLLRIHLRESPATGYYWELQPQLPASLRLEAEPGQGPRMPADEQAHRSWSFRAEHADLVHLRFDYRRAWDGNADARDAIVFELHVN